MVEKGEVVSKNEKIATHFNNYFKGLNIKKWRISDKLSHDPLVNAIRKYENHPSIIKIKSSVETTQLFDFNFVSSDDIPILFNVFINDLLLFIKETDICNFADDTTLYACGKELDIISFKLEIETNRAMQCLKDNKMVANPSKFQLMFF